MYSIKDCYNILKTSVVCGTISALGTTVVISALGVLAHVAKYASDNDISRYSLKNRFETAYSLKTPEEHKYYYEIPYYNGYAGDTQKTYYLASPYATYGTIAALGLAGAIAGGRAGAKIIKNRKLIAARKKYKAR